MEQECWVKGEDAPIPCGHPGTAIKAHNAQAGQIVLVLGEDRLCAARFVLGPPGIRLLPGLQPYPVGYPLGPPTTGHAP